MSRLLYIASDHPLPPRPNPHERMLSVNEALSMGLRDIPQALLAPGFDRDRPGTLLWADRRVHINVDTGSVEDGNFDDDFALLDAKGCDDVYTKKRYAVYIEWHAWTEGRARGVIEYIRENLAHTDEVELWSIWMGFAEPPIVRTKTLRLCELRPEHIKALEEEREICAGMAGCEIPVQHRIVIPSHSAAGSSSSPRKSGAPLSRSSTA